MRTEIHDSRLPYCVSHAWLDENQITVELKGSVILAEHLTLIDKIMDEKLSFLYSITFNPISQKLELNYW